ncbi:MAG: hypothetical protein K0R34_1581 [Herbinix sp.]|jgi:hypothetical protein|nr:hypothetical protein [Herbinix sp.]
MSIGEEYDETIQDLIDLIDQEINKHYEVNFIAGLERAEEIIKEYFDSIS